MRKYLILALILAIVLIISGSGYIVHLKREKSRLQGVYEAQVEREDMLKNGIQYEKTRNNELMARISALELSNSEIRQTQGGMMESLKNMRIALRKVESYSAINTETTYNIETTLKDSIIRDTIIVEYIEYHSHWLDLEAYKISDKLNLKIESRDSLIQVIFWEREKFLRILPIGRKRYSQKITSANPDSRIIYSEFIVPHKK